MAIYEQDRWQDRHSENPTRRELTVESDVTTDNVRIITATVARADGEVDVVGTPFNAEKMNGLENRINNAFTGCLEFVDSGIKVENNDSINAGWYSLSSTISDKIVQCPILEFYYTNGDTNDGITCSKVFIPSYNELTRVSLDQIACGSGSNDNNFYLKTVVLEIRKHNGVIQIRRIRDRSKRLYGQAINSGTDLNPNWNINNFNVERCTTEYPDIVDISIYKMIGYRFVIPQEG